MHDVAEPETLEHLCLRQAKAGADLQEFFGQSTRPRARVTHQKFPPEGSQLRVHCVRLWFSP
jgi:hypothetical protein